MGFLKRYHPVHDRHFLHRYEHTMNTTTNIRAGEILQSNEGAFYRVLEATPFSVSLMRVDGQTIFACRTEYVEMNFSMPTPETA